MSKIYNMYWKTNIKKFSVGVKLFEIKYLKTKTKTQNLEIYMKFSLKIGLLSLFFLFDKVILRWKWKLRNNRGVLEDFKRKWERKTRKRKEKKEEKEKQNKKKTKFFPLPSKTMDCFSGRLMSTASDQKLFCKLCSPFCCSFNEFVEENVITPSYTSAILTPPLNKYFWYLVVDQTLYYIVNRVLVEEAGIKANY